MSLPESWAETTVGKVVVDLQPGFAQRPGEDDEGMTSQIRTHNISPVGKITLAGIKHVSANANELERYKLVAGDVVFNNTNSEEWVGKTAVFDQEGEYVFSNHMTRLRADARLVNPDYLASYLQLLWSMGYSKTRAKRWVSQAGIEGAALASFKLPLPTLLEQQRIVDVLRQAESLGKNRSDTRAKIDRASGEYYDKLFGNVFANDKSWPVVKLGKVSDIVRGSSPRPQGDSRLYGGPIPRLMVSDLTRDGLWVDAKTDTLTEEGAKSSRAMPARSVVMAVSGAPGITAILNHDACIHDGFVGLRDLDQNLLPEFVAYTLNLLRAKNDQQAVGAVFRNLTTDQVKAISIPLPPTDLQCQFQEFLFQVKTIQADIARSDKLLTELLSTIHIEAFSGELTASWRQDHLAKINEAVVARDSALSERGAKVSIRTEVFAPPERPADSPRTAHYWLLNELSEFQGFVLDAMSEWKGTLLADNASDLDEFCRLWPIEHERNMHDRAKRALEQLAALGLIAKVALANDNGDFVTGYRQLRLEEKSRFNDIAVLQASLESASHDAGTTS